MSPKSQDEEHETPSPKPKTLSSPLFSFKLQNVKEKKTLNEKYQRTDDYAQVSIVSETYSVILECSVFSCQNVRNANVKIMCGLCD